MTQYSDNYYISLLWTKHKKSFNHLNNYALFLSSSFARVAMFLIIIL
jgi:hypothetical protein